MIVLAESNLVLELAFQQEQSSEVENVSQTLKRADVVERQGVAETVRRLIACCRVQALTDTIIENAYGFESRFELGPHDAVVFASIEAALREREARRDSPRPEPRGYSRNLIQLLLEEHIALRSHAATSSSPTAYAATCLRVRSDRG